MKRRRRRANPADLAAGMEWNRRVTALGCQVCSVIGEECDGVVQGHHVVYQQFISRWVDAHAHENDLAALEKADLLRRLLWDVRNGMGLCSRAHRRHHNRSQPIPLYLVPIGALAFAAEIGLAHRIEALYPAEQTGRLTPA